DGIRDFHVTGVQTCALPIYGGDVAAVLSAGAQGAMLGTALLATHESFAHPYHQQRIVDAREGDTLLTEDFHINWPRGAGVRVLENGRASCREGVESPEGAVS